MQEHSPFAATLIQRLDGDDAALTLPLRASSTIAPERSRADEPGRGAVAALQRADVGEGLQMLATLGEGGMGVVRAARQVRLGREVAVKSLRDGVDDEVATLNLLREAWVTGMLEHPNVVPVHDVTLDALGRPRIVLKRIDGSPWAELLGDDRAVLARFGARDAFEWHARVLLQVANAVQFAHSRGILHRDIKPENVMIGAFGEVYLLDWGIAVSLVDDGTGRLPLACDAVELAGTPVYMAPEMICGEAGRLSPRTDVYLLGAVLFELVSGRPPHDGSNLREVMARILSSPPPLPSSCPPELARVIHTAMALEPADRFADADAFRSALAAYLEHRGSLRLAEDAAERAAALESALAGCGDRAPADVRVALYRMFAEARFGFLEALRAWPENEAAERGLRRAVERMVRFELESGDPGAALALLSELASPDPALLERAEEARAAQARAERRRRRLEADVDPGIGRRTRAVLGGVLGTLWSASPFTAWVLERTGVHARTLDDAVVSSIGMVALGAVLAWWARETLRQTAINRTMRDAAIIAVIGQLALYVGARELGLGMAVTESVKLLFYATVVAHIAAVVDRMFWWTTAGYLVAFALAVDTPVRAHLLEAGANVVLTVTILAIWGVPRERQARAAPPASGPSRSRP